MFVWVDAGSRYEMQYDTIAASRWGSESSVAMLLWLTGLGTADTTVQVSAMSWTLYMEYLCPSFLERCYGYML